MVWISKEIHVTLLLTVRSRQQGQPSPTAANEFVREGRSLWLPPSPKICPTPGRLSSSFYVMRRPHPPPLLAPHRAPASPPSCISHIRLSPRATRAWPFRTCPSQQSKLDCKETKTNVTNRMCYLFWDQRSGWPSVRAFLLCSAMPKQFSVMLPVCCHKIPRRWRNTVIVQGGSALRKKFPFFSLTPVFVSEAANS